MTINEAIEILQREYNCRIDKGDVCASFPISCNGCEHYVDADTVTEALKTVLELFGKSSELPNSSGDLISRQAAIDVLRGYFDEMLETDTWSPCDVYGLIEILPSAQAEQKWIPCKENMPDPDKLVIMQCRGKKWPSGYRYFQTLGVWIPPLTVKAEDKWTQDSDTEDLEVYDEDTDTYYCEAGWYEETTQGDGDNMSWRMNADVIAWMPLPESYKGGADESQTD